MNRSKILCAMGVLLAAIAFGVLGSAAASAQDSGTDSGGEGDVFRIGWAQDPKTLNPFVGVNEEEYTIWALNWELLINFNPEDLSPAPGIAESWETSEDGKTITFNLDQGCEVVRRGADHVQGRQVLARGSRRQRPALRRLHEQHQGDPDA